MALASSEVRRNRRAAVYLLASVLGISVLPLAMVVVGAPESPLLFGASLSVGTSVGALGFLFARYGPQLRDGRIRSLIRNNLVSWPIFFLLLGTFEFTFFAWGTRFVDATVATILWGSWPIIFVFLLSRIFRGSRERPARYRKITPSLVLLMVFSLIGLAYVVLAQATRQSGFDLTSDSSWVGFAFAMLSGILITFNIFSFSWSTSLAAKAKNLGVSHQSHSLELFFITVIVCISNAFTAPFKAGFSLLASEQIQTDVILAGLIVGGTIRVGSSLLWRHANLTTHALGINALGYAEPLFGVLWLALFWEVNIPRVDYLILGTCAIIASNILINSEVEISAGFKSAILAMWTTGAIVYFRNDGPLWESGRLFGILAILAGVFALLVGLRVGNPSPVTGGKHAPAERHRPQAAPRPRKPSRIGTGLNIAQMATIGIYAAAGVTIAVVVRPATTGWTGWLVEIFAVSYCTAIVASSFYASDSPKRFRRRLAAATGGEEPVSAGHRSDRRERRIAHWSTLVTAAGTYIAFLYLLWDKWLGGGG